MIEEIQKITNLKFNDMQLKAINHFKGPALTLAVPGSGKTTLLLTRTVNLIKKHSINPENILTITFSKMASIDMQKRYNYLFKEYFNYNISFSTIHSFCYKMLRAYSKKKNLNYKLLEGENGISKQKILSDIYLNINRKYITEDKLEELSNNISYIKNMMLTSEEIKNKFSNDTNIEKIFLNYEKFKIDNNFIDFDDMLTLSYKILKEHPKALEYYQNKFQFIQVDETQDTSKIQHKIIELIAGKNQNVFMVADDDQSIYGFRGAYPDLLLNFSKIYKNPDIYYLETNYRSSKNIIDICNASIKNNTIRYKKKINYFKNTSGNIEIINFDDISHRNKYIVEIIKKNQNKEFGILYRNNISSITLANTLDLEAVEFNVKSNNLIFFNHWVTKDIKDILSLSLIPQDIQTFENIYYKINGYISKKMLMHIKSNFSNKNVFDILLSYKGLKKHQINKLRTIKQILKNISTQKPSDAIQIIMEDLGYVEFLSNRSDKEDYSFISLINILESLKTIALSCDSILDFFERLDKLEKIINQNTKNYYCNIKLSTIHSSKGLEYENVILIDVENESFPTKSSIKKYEKKEINALEEERRLFYVAISRCKENLKILNVKFKNGTYIKPSMFLNEIKSNEYVSEKSFKNTTKQNLEYKIGQKVFHKIFAEGVVIDCSENIVKIDFNGSLKELSISVVKEYKLLK